VLRASEVFHAPDFNPTDRLFTLHFPQLHQEQPDE
jgi:hypothetical protein